MRDSGSQERKGTVACNNFFIPYALEFQIRLYNSTLHD
jgi:hypothetical protein